MIIEDAWVLSPMVHQTSPKQSIAAKSPYQRLKTQLELQQRQQQEEEQSAFDAFVAATVAHAAASAARSAAAAVSAFLFGPTPNSEALGNPNSAFNPKKESDAAEADFAAGGNSVGVGGGTDVDIGRDTLSPVARAMILKARDNTRKGSLVAHSDQKATEVHDDSNTASSSDDNDSRPEHRLVKLQAFYRKYDVGKVEHAAEFMRCLTWRQINDNLRMKYGHTADELELENGSVESNEDRGDKITERTSQDLEAMEQEEDDDLHSRFVSDTFDVKIVENAPSTLEQVCQIVLVVGWPSHVLLF